MKFQVILYCVLVSCSHIVVSIPLEEEAIRQSAYQHPNWPGNYNGPEQYYGTTIARPQSVNPGYQHQNSPEFYSHQERNNDNYGFYKYPVPRAPFEDRHDTFDSIPDGRLNRNYNQANRRPHDEFASAVSTANAGAIEERPFVNTVREPYRAQSHNVYQGIHFASPPPSNLQYHNSERNTPIPVASGIYKVREPYQVREPVQEKEIHQERPIFRERELYRQREQYHNPTIEDTGVNRHLNPHPSGYNRPAHYEPKTEAFTVASATVAKNEPQNDYAPRPVGTLHQVEPQRYGTPYNEESPPLKNIVGATKRFVIVHTNGTVEYLEKLDPITQNSRNYHVVYDGPIANVDAVEIDNGHKPSLVVPTIDHTFVNSPIDKNFQTGNFPMDSLDPIEHTEYSPPLEISHSNNKDFKAGISDSFPLGPEVPTDHFEYGPPPAIFHSNDKDFKASSAKFPIGPNGPTDHSVYIPAISHTFGKDYKSDTSDNFPIGPDSPTDHSDYVALPEIPHFFNKVYKVDTRDSFGSDGPTAHPDYIAPQTIPHSFNKDYRADIRDSFPFGPNGPSDHSDHISPPTIPHSFSKDYKGDMRDNFPFGPNDPTDHSDGTPPPAISHSFDKDYKADTSDSFPIGINSPSDHSDYIPPPAIFDKDFNDDISDSKAPFQHSDFVPPPEIFDKDFKDDISDSKVPFHHSDFVPLPETFDKDFKDHIIDIGSQFQADHPDDIVNPSTISHSFDTDFTARHKTSTSGSALVDSLDPVLFPDFDTTTLATTLNSETSKPFTDQDHFSHEDIITISPIELATDNVRNEPSIPVGGETEKNIPEVQDTDNNKQDIVEIKKETTDDEFYKGTVVTLGAIPIKDISFKGQQDVTKVDSTNKSIADNNKDTTPSTPGNFNTQIAYEKDFSTTYNEDFSDSTQSTNQIEISKANYDNSKAVTVDYYSHSDGPEIIDDHLLITTTSPIQSDATTVGSTGLPDDKELDFKPSNDVTVKLNIPTDDEGDTISISIEVPTDDTGKDGQEHANVDNASDDGDTIVLSIATEDGNKGHSGKTPINVTHTAVLQTTDDDIKNFEIDLSNIKDKPVVWFRTTDADFLDKLTAGEGECQVIYFFQVRPQPLIEKDTRTTIYANGTVVEDITETIYQNREDPSPKIIKTSRIIHLDDPPQ